MRAIVSGRIVAVLMLAGAIFATGRSMVAQTGVKPTVPFRLPPREAVFGESCGEAPSRLPTLASTEESTRLATLIQNKSPDRLPSLEPPMSPQPPAPSPPDCPGPRIETPLQVVPRSTADAEPPNWEQLIVEPWRNGDLAYLCRPDAPAVEVTVDSLVLAALEHSEHIRAIRQAPLIWQEDIVRERAFFDVAAFIDSRWRDISEPVGSTLTTGGPPRFNDHDWRTTAGLRKRTAWGGVIEMSQRIGLQDTNSVFFVPADQGTTRFSLSFSQPLLRNRGRAYNQGLIVIAETNAGIAHHTMMARLEDHLLETAKAYWRLVLHRESAAQRRRHVAMAEELFVELERRRELDLLRNQSLRAQAAVATRRAALTRAETEVRNAESEIARLTGSGHWNTAELIPVEPLTAECVLPDTEAALQTALARRPEIAGALERVRQAEIRLAMSKNELMPALNLVLESYLMGLEGDFDVMRSLNEQYTDGAPSYTAGLIFEMPLGNRAAQAGLRRRRHETAQLMHELNAVLADTRTEVEKAVRTAHTAWREMIAKAQAVTATEAELNYLHARWRTLQGADGAVSFLLTDILDAQDRLIQSEAELSHARYAWAVSVLELKHATGELMSIEQ